MGNEISNKKDVWKKYATGLISLLLMFFFFLSASGQVSPGPEKPVYTQTMPYSYIFTVFFLVLGPFKIIAPFTKMTAGADRALSRNIAIRAIAFSSVALLIAAFLGDSILKKYEISIPVLALTGGIILFLVALIAIIQQFQPIHAHDEINELPTLKMAMTPLAFPIIVTPYGIATLIVFLGLVPDSGRKVILAIVSVIMLLNLIFMLVTRLISQKIIQIFLIFLQILASILGIIQVALGIKIIYRSLLALLK